MLAACCLALLLAPAPEPQPAFTVHAVELDLWVDPQARLLAAKTTLNVRSRRRRPQDRIVLALPAPFAGRTDVKAVWDHTGELAWRLERTEPALLIHVVFASPVHQQARRTVVVNYELDFSGLGHASAAQVDARTIRLQSFGWYPWPREAPAGIVPRPRLGVRLPHGWRIEPAGRFRLLRRGPQFAEYERSEKRLPAGRLLFSAGAE